MPYIYLPSRARLSEGEQARKNRAEIEPELPSRGISRLRTS